MRFPPTIRIQRQEWGVRQQNESRRFGTIWWFQAYRGTPNRVSERTSEVNENHGVFTTGWSRIRKNASKSPWLFDWAFSKP